MNAGSKLEHPAARGEEVEAEPFAPSGPGESGAPEGRHSEGRPLRPSPEVMAIFRRNLKKWDRLYRKLAVS